MISLPLKARPRHPQRLTAANLSWSLQPQPRLLSQLTEARLVLLDSGDLAVELRSNQISGFLTLFVVYSFIFTINLVALRTEYSQQSHFLSVFLAITFPSFYKCHIDTSAVNVVLLYFGWNILVTTLPILCPTAAFKKAKVSPVTAHNNKSVQIDMYTQARDGQLDKMSWTKKSRNLFFVFYILSILFSFGVLFAIFYETVTENILDMLRENI